MRTRNLRADIPAVSYSASLVTDEEVGVIMARGGRHSEEHRRRNDRDGRQPDRGVKEIQALGAFDGGERSKAMDMLGFKKQLVFATHSVTMPFSPSSKISPKLRYGAARAHNRHMADFCAHDSRLMGVAVVPLDEPAFALEELEFALQAPVRKPSGFLIVLPATSRPATSTFDPFWARLRSRTLRSSCTSAVAAANGIGWINNGRPPTKDWMGGGENLRTKDVAVLHEAIETFLSMMLIDGVFERFPKLRGGCVELGAGWVPSMLTRLDWMARFGARPTPTSRLHTQAVGADHSADGVYSLRV